MPCRKQHRIGYVNCSSFNFCVSIVPNGKLWFGNRGSTPIYQSLVVFFPSFGWYSSTFSIPSVTRREESRGYSSFLMVISIMAKTSSDSRVTRTFGGGAQLPEELYHLLFLQGLFDVFFVVHNYFFICYNTSLTVNFHAYHCYCLLNNQVCLFYFKDS